MKNQTINKEKKPTKLIITQGGITITLFNKWVIILFAKNMTEEQIKNLLKK